MSGQESEDERARRLLTRQEQTNLPKRFYKHVAVAPVVDGHEIRLDGRAVKTPLKRALVMPGKAMAHAVAAEWEAQKTYIDPATMMMTKLANTAVDRVHGDEDRIIAEIVQFAGSDLVCYRAEAPAALVDRQAQGWDPVLDWARDTHGALFVCVAGIVHQTQPEASLQRLSAALKGENPFRLTAIHNMTTLTGSALLAIMLAGGGCDADAAWAAAHLDEDWQIEQWGEDEEASARRAYRKSDFDASVQFLEMAGS